MAKWEFAARVNESGVLRTWRWSPNAEEPQVDKFIWTGDSLDPINVEGWMPRIS